MNTILAIGNGIFFLSSLYFYLKPRSEFNTPFIVSFVTLISYLIMLEGKFVIGGTDQGIYWTRWVGYAVSCPLLMYSIARKLGFNLGLTATNMFLTALVMLTGAYAGVSNGNTKWIFFALSCLSFTALMIPVLKSKSENLSKILPFILIGWFGFPIIFLLSFEGFGILQNYIVLPIYLGLDVLTKILFYFHSSENLENKL